MGVRFDYLNAFNPAISLPAGPFVPARKFDQVDCVPCWKDIDPRVGFAYDLFGNGKTAIKADIGRYVAGEGVALATSNHPLETSVTSTTRTWGDTNRDYVPDCDLTNPAQNGECGAIDNTNFGLNNPRAARYGSDVLTGWRHRNNNWQTSASVQHEFLGGVAMNVGYFRRWYGNFQVTDNRATTPADFSAYCITAPVDSRLPGGGGNQICGLYDVNPTKFGQVQSLISLNSNYGSQTEVYDGVDVTLTARIRRGAFLAGGFNTGRTETNNCDVVLGRPQVTFTVALSTITGPRTQAYCDVVTPWRGQTQVKFAGAYPLPWWDLQTSATFQSLPGVPRFATYVATNNEITPSLGRNLAAGARGTVTVDLIPPQTEFEGRVYQLDLRMTKIVKLGRTRLQGMFDVYNALNASPILAINSRYGSSWLTPTTSLPGRLVKFGFQADF
jgi:hypothetical protein